MFKRKLIFGIYIITLFAVLISFLIFFPKNKSGNNEIPKSEISSNEPTDNKPINPEEENTPPVIEPEIPNDPIKPENPNENPSEEPNNPIIPDNPEDLTTPDNPGNNENPVEPNNPSDPINPDVPTEPESPTVPDNPNEPEGDNPNIPNENPNDPEDETKYAESITLLCPREITMSINSKVKLLDGFLSIVPSNITDYSIEIEPKSVNNENGLEINERTITATKTGFYTIYFIVPKTKKTFLKDYLVVEVVSELLDDKITQISSVCEINEEIEIDELFTISDTNYVVAISNLDVAIITENKFKALKIGEHDIDLSLSKDYISYIYTFPILVKEEPNITLDLYIDDEILTDNLTIEKSVGERFLITYELLENNVLTTNQEIDVEIVYSEAVKIISIKSPIITLECIGKGCVKLIITAKQSGTKFEISFNLQ